MTTGQPTDRDGYTRARDAEPRLQPIVAMVDALCALAGPDTRTCSACAWEHIVKPLCMPLIRGARTTPGGHRARPPVALRALALTRSPLAILPEPPDPVSDEVWLRSPAAFDAFTDPLLARLDDADPDNGHGFGRLTPDGAGCEGRATR